MLLNLANSSLNLANSSLNLANSSLNLANSSLNLANSSLNLADFQVFGGILLILIPLKSSFGGSLSSGEPGINPST